MLPYLTNIPTNILKGLAHSKNENLYLKKILIFFFAKRRPFKDEYVFVEKTITVFNSFLVEA